MRTACLGIGSNLDAERNVNSAIDALSGYFECVEFSPIYRATAVGFDGGDFINLVARVETEMSPLELKRWLHELEDRHGRVRNVPKFSDRTLDIDILLYDDLFLLSPELEIPRFEILEAAYVLKPLADLAPDLVHPVACKTVAQLWSEFPAGEARLTAISLDGAESNGPGSE
jgi:2-amino-4-hydroxy-6-hydroxymethyldihydropteridine diphosphokinase